MLAAIPIPTDDRTFRQKTKSKQDCVSYVGISTTPFAESLGAPSRDRKGVADASLSSYRN